MEINKCRGSCNNVNDPHPKLCIPEVVKTKMSKCLV